jgi:hypothetical protein
MKLRNVSFSDPDNKIKKYELTTMNARNVIPSFAFWRRQTDQQSKPLEA